ncbi:MAG: aminotransferase class I/II-fold pyridoxal phosphate-dependent enzyme [Alphaproteobacteria bacterium]|nr:aminotransferase class I/II-fold pyridoxal phosphate-dependent enzyme [Alphaproteobacteria bacterium]
MSPGAAYAAPIRDLIASMETTKIGQVANLGRGDADVIKLWFGESDVKTPAFINRAATKALDEGHTFYTWQRGIPPLREAIARYTSRVYGIDCDTDRITVMGSGMQVIVLCCQAILDAGDNVVVVSPAWPNVSQAIEVMGADARPVRQILKGDRWTLDLDQLFARVDSRTRAIFVNSPCNPTGWMMTSEEQKAVLDFCRKRRIWLLADEVYARLVYDRDVAPSFLHHATPDDPLIVVQSFSKPWAMTGWRLGWMTSPAAFGDKMANLVQFNTSGSPAFLQYGALAAIEEGEEFLKSMVERCRAGGEIVFQRLAALPRVRVARPQATFYAFFAVDGMTDSLAFAQKLVREARVGLAPGSAFGDGGEGYLRLCFAQSPERLVEALDRMEPFLR